MAKKKAARVPGSFTVRCGPSYRAWLGRFLKKTQLGSVTTLVTQALLAYAAKRQFEPPPDRKD